MAVYQTVQMTVAASVSTTVSQWIPMDFVGDAPFNVGFGLTFPDGGPVLARVEHTFDDIQDSNASITSFVHTDVSGTNTQIDGNYAFPVRAIRLSIVSAAASGTAKLTVIQAGG